MWEAIEENRRRSRWLILWMAGVLALLGAVLGMLVSTVIFGLNYRYGGAEAVGPVLGVPLYVFGYGAAGGVAVSMVVWLILLAMAFKGGDRFLLSSAGARKIDRLEAPQLHNVVEEMTIASGLGQPPDVWVIDDAAPNAFAVGRDPEKAQVAVTTGLLERLGRDELQGVMAHEIGHIKNLDVRFMTFAGVLVGAIVMVAEGFLRMLFGGGGRHHRRHGGGFFYIGGGRSRGGGGSSSGGGGKGGGGAAIIVVILILLVLSIIMALLAPVMARLLYFASSRRREYLADASAALYTRYPEGLASALEKIASGARARSKPGVSRTLAPMYTVNPLAAAGGSSIFSTHPPTDTRVNVLRAMGGGADYAAYEEAFRKASGGESCIGERTLSESRRVEAREASPEEKDPKRAKRYQRDMAREMTDFFARMGGLAIIGCSCGMRIKVPPQYEEPAILCPRCGTSNDIPMAGAKQAPMTAAAAVPVEARGDAQPLVYKRKQKGQWESLRCGACHNAIQLSPAFAGTRLKCPSCQATIQIEQNEESDQ